MSNVDLAKDFCEALGRGDAETANRYITDDFVVTGPTPQPLGKAEFLGLHAILAQAFPDFNFNVSQVVETGDQVELTIQITGTNTGVLDLSPTGMPIPPVPPTGKHIQLAVEHPSLTLRNGKFSGLNLPVVPGGGLVSILSQIGLEVPH
jgi:predicted ester cyclase